MSEANLRERDKERERKRERVREREGRRERESEEWKSAVDLRYIVHVTVRHLTKSDPFLNKIA